MLSYNQKVVSIHATRFEDLTIKPRSVAIQTLLTSPAIRSKVELDLKIMRFLDKNHELNVNELAVMTRSTPRSVKNSLKRLNQWWFSH